MSEPRKLICEKCKSGPTTLEVYGTALCPTCGGLIIQNLLEELTRFSGSKTLIELIKGWLKS